MERDFSKYNQTERPKAIELFLNALQTAVRAKRAYLYENQGKLDPNLIQKAFDQLGGCFNGHDRIELLVKPYYLFFGGRLVYENNVPKESLSLPLFDDGIRLIVFKRGMRLEEIQKMIDIFITDFSESAVIDESLYCLLSEAELPHLDVVGADAMREAQYIEKVKKIEFDHFVNQVVSRTLKKPRSGARKLRERDLKVLDQFRLSPEQFLRTDQEVRRIVRTATMGGKERHREEEAYGRLLEMGFYFLQKGSSRQEIKIGQDLLFSDAMMFLEAHQFDLLESLVDRVRKIQSDPTPQSHVCTLLLNQIYHPDRLSDFSPHLEYAGNKEPLIQILKKAPPSGICLIILLMEIHDWLGKELSDFILTNIPAQMPWLLEQVQRNPENDAWEQLVKVFSKEPSPDFHLFLNIFLETNSRVVRARVLKELVRVGTVDAINIFRHFLRSSKREVRFQAYDYLSQGKSKAVVRILRDHIESEGFGKLSDDEQQRAFEGILIVSKKTCLPWMSKLWSKEVAKGLLPLSKSQGSHRWHLVLVRAIGSTFPELLDEFILASTDIEMEPEVKEVVESYSSKAEKKGAKRYI